MEKSKLIRASVYVGTYKKYNEGSLAGAWLELADYKSKDEFMEACKELHSDEDEPEFMYQDYNNIPDGVYEGFAKLSVGKNLLIILKSKPLGRLSQVVLCKAVEQRHKYRRYAEYKKHKHARRDVRDAVGRLPAQKRRHHSLFRLKHYFTTLFSALAKRRNRAWSVSGNARFL